MPPQNPAEPNEQLVDQIDDAVMEEFILFLAAKQAAAANPPPAVAPASPVTPTRTSPSSRLPSRRPETSPDINALVRDLVIEAKKSKGLTGRAKEFLFGNPIDRDQADDIKRRLRAVADMQRGDVAKELVVAGRNKGVEIVANALNGQESHIEGFESDSAANEVGQQMLEDNKQRLYDLNDMIALGVERKILEDLGFNK